MVPHKLYSAPLFANYDLVCVGSFFRNFLFRQPAHADFWLHTRIGNSSPLFSFTSFPLGVVETSSFYCGARNNASSTDVFTAF